jgi:glycosyltransferase involved in cell wall biosynthesis
VGRIIRAKGVDRLLHACEILKQCGFSDFSVTLVGKGPHQDEFASLSRKLGIEGQVRWEGFVPYEKLGSYYESCDVFVLPSLEDTWGVVALEAMAFGKPVLCSRFAGSSELVEHGVSGYVFDPDKPEELACYMRSFIERPQLIARQGTAARAIMEQFTPRRAAVTLSQIIQKTLMSESALNTCDLDEEGS